MKRIIPFFLAIILCSTFLYGENQKVAVLAFEKNDRESDYVVSRLMKSDFKEIFEENENLDMVDMKDSKKVFSESGYSDLSYVGKEEIAKMGETLGADVVIWGNVSALTASEFKVLAKVFSMKSQDVIAVTFNVKKDSESRQQAIKDNLIAKIEEFSGGEIDKLLGIGVQHFNSKNYPSAEETFKNLLEIDPNNLEASFYLGLIYYIDKNYPESENYYLKALEIDPGNTDVLDYLSQTYLKQRKYQEAIDALTEIAENDGDQTIWLKIGNIYEEMEYFEEAMESYENALYLDEEFADAQLAIAQLHYRQERFEAAIPYFELASTAFPDDDDLQKKLASCYKKTGNLENAIIQYESIIAEQPDNFRAYVNLAGAYNEMERYQKALETSNKLIEIAPDDPRVYILISSTYSFLKNFAKAEENANKAIQLDPELYQPYRILSEIYQSRGYAQYEEFLRLEEEAKSAYGKEADELVDKRDLAKSNAYNHFVRSKEYLEETKTRTDNRSEMKYIESRENTLNKLMEATKKDFF
ncbi:MAG: tetratricopeptide repeat protein [Candidatus Cloacimonetes bacterium]|nr:tetratricopeptide repeat protein [Candidatus Cloacimonadota bacterium]